MAAHTISATWVVPSSDEFHHLTQDCQDAVIAWQKAQGLDLVRAVAIKDGMVMADTYLRNAEGKRYAANDQGIEHSYTNPELCDWGLRTCNPARAWVTVPLTQTPPELVYMQPPPQPVFTW